MAFPPCPKNHSGAGFSEVGGSDVEKSCWLFFNKMLEKYAFSTGTVLVRFWYGFFFNIFSTFAPLFTTDFTIRFGGPEPDLAQKSVPTLRKISSILCILYIMKHVLLPEIIHTS